MAQQNNVVGVIRRIVFRERAPRSEGVQNLHRLRILDFALAGGGNASRGEQARAENNGADRLLIRGVAGPHVVVGERPEPVPLHLRDASYRGAEQLARGGAYQYAHDFEGGWVDQAYLPEERRYYEPVDRGYEAEIRQRLLALREKQSAAGDAGPALP